MMGNTKPLILLCLWYMNIKNTRMQKVANKTDIWAHLNPTFILCTVSPSLLGLFRVTWYITYIGLRII